MDQLRIDSWQARQRSRIETIIFSPALDNQAHFLGVRDDHFVPQRRQQSTHPWRMRSGLDFRSSECTKRTNGILWY